MSQMWKLWKMGGGFADSHQQRKVEIVEDVTLLTMLTMTSANFSAQLKCSCSIPYKVSPWTEDAAIYHVDIGYCTIFKTVRKGNKIIGNPSLSCHRTFGFIERGIDNLRVRQSRFHATQFPEIISLQDCTRSQACNVRFVHRLRLKLCGLTSRSHSKKMYQTRATYSRKLVVATGQYTPNCTVVQITVRGSVALSANAHTSQVSHCERFCPTKESGRQRDE